MLRLPSPKKLFQELKRHSVFQSGHHGGRRPLRTSAVTLASTSAGRLC